MIHHLWGLGCTNPWVASRVPVRAGSFARSVAFRGGVSRHVCGARAERGHARVPLQPEPIDRKQVYTVFADLERHRGVTVYRGALPDGRATRDFVARLDVHPS